MVFASEKSKSLCTRVNSLTGVLVAEKIKALFIGVDLFAGVLTGEKIQNFLHPGQLTRSLAIFHFYVDEDIFGMQVKKCNFCDGEVC